MSRFKNGFKTYHDAYSTILILIDDSRNDFSKFLLLGDVSLACNHDALGLRRTGSMEGFRAVADSSAAKAHVLDEAHDALPFFRRDVIAAHKELPTDFSDGFPIFADNHFGLEVLFAWHGDHDTAGNVFSKTYDFIGEAGDVLFADVGKQQVNLVVPGLRGAAFAGAGKAAAKERFVKVGHFNEFILDMACLFNTVIFSGKGSSTDEDVADTDFTAAVGLTVVTSKTFNHHAGKFRFPVKEDHVIGDEDVVEDNEGFLTAEFCVPKIDVGTVFQLAGIAGLTAIDHIQAFGVGRAGKADGPILIGFLHGDGGHENVPMGVDGTCLVDFGAANDNAVRTAFHDMDEDVRVFLFMRRLGAVPFRIRHGTVYGQILILDIDEELLEVFVVMGSVFFVDFIGRGVYGVEGVHTDRWKQLAVF